MGFLAALPLVSAGVNAITGDRAAKRAAGAQVEAANTAAETQLTLAHEGAARLEPFRQAGLDALTRYQELLGLVPVRTPRRAAPATQAPAQAPAQAPVNRDTWIGQQLVPVTDPETGKVQLMTIAQARNQGWMTRKEEKALRAQYAQQYDRQFGSTSTQGPTLQGGTIRDLVRKAVATTTQPPVSQNAAPPVPVAAPAAAPRSIEDLLRATPGYAFQTAEEERAIERAAAGRGQRMSGNVLEELARRAGERAMTTAYDTQLRSLAGLAGQGQSAAAGAGGMLSGAAPGVASSQMAVGSALAGQQIAQAGIRGGFLQDIARIGSNPDALDQLGIYSGQGGGSVYRTDSSLR